jgi:hypothetical protein
MARISRYPSYYKAVAGRGKTKSTKSSILRSLRELKGQEFVMNVPVE